MKSWQNSRFFNKEGKYRKSANVDQDPKPKKTINFDWKTYEKYRNKIVEWIEQSIEKGETKQETIKKMAESKTIQRWLVDYQKFKETQHKYLSIEEIVENIYNNAQRIKRNETGER